MSSEATGKPLNPRDPATFDDIVRTHRSSVYGGLRSQMSSIPDAEQLTQEVFSSLYRHAKAFTTESELQSWLSNATRGALAAYVSAHRKQGGVSWSELCLEFGENEPHDVLRGDRSRVRECLELLEPSSREAIEFKYSGERDLAEVSRRMRRSEDAVKLLIYRARQTLRQCLERAGEKA
jgi:RNA polymerase sigma-70 factor, ECF subfamily